MWSGTSPDFRPSFDADYQVSLPFSLAPQAGQLSLPFGDYVIPWAEFSGPSEESTKLDLPVIEELLNAAPGSLASAPKSGLGTKGVELTTSSPATSRWEILQEWSGVVTDIDEERGTFSANLTDRTAGELMPSDVAEFEIANLRDDDKELLDDGAVFSWVIGRRHGRRVTTESNIWFRRLPTWTPEKIERAALKSAELRRAFQEKTYPNRPEPSEIEFTVIGPGFGEAILIHLGDAKWVLIDSCWDQESKSSASLRYLDELGFRPETDVIRLILSHWDDDHVAGMGALFGRCQSAEILLSAAFDRNDIQDYARLVRDEWREERSGVDELNLVFEEAGQRRKPPTYVLGSHRELVLDPSTFQSRSAGRGLDSFPFIC
ncbi:MAG: MBL fold metallo-hydrolase [Alphaproteobacteria bacterium]